MKYLTFLFLLSFTISFSQKKILIQNKSFEELDLKDWNDCGLKLFPSESPPDIHSDSSELKLWGVENKASDKIKFLGLVVRDNDSYESVTQKLSEPMEKGKCYKISVDISISENYLSHSRVSGKQINYKTPCELRIWGSNSFCFQHQLLAKSNVIENTEWRKIEFEFKALVGYKYITIEAFWKTPIFYYYCGHILIDNLSDLEEIECNSKLNTNY